MSTKCDIYNLALTALLLTKQIIDTDTDTSAENRTLNVVWPTALKSTLADLDMDATSIKVPLQLVAGNEGFDFPQNWSPQAYVTGSPPTPCPPPTIGCDVVPGGWRFAYAYPQNCTFFRRLMPHHLVHEWRKHRQTRRDIRSTQVPREIGTLNGRKVIFTNEHRAWGQYIPSDLNITTLSEPAAMAIAYKLAELAAPLVAGKGAGPLRKEIRDMYKVWRAEAMELDRLENATFDTDIELSEFVEARLS